MSSRVLRVFPAYLGGYDPVAALADSNVESSALVVTRNLDASAAYLVIGDEPEAADEVFEKHLDWPDRPVIWIDGGGAASYYRTVRDFVDVRNARFEEVFPAQTESESGVVFSPMPAPKPTGGFIEIGACNRHAYAFEGLVELLAGSDGRVYAVVAEHISDLPDLDDEGSALLRSEPIRDESRAGLCCPKCGGKDIFVVRVSCMEHTRPHTGRWPLAVDGFVWDEAGSHLDGSTEDEIAECNDCGYFCPPGALHEFGFGR